MFEKEQENNRLKKDLNKVHSEKVVTLFNPRAEKSEIKPKNKKIKLPKDIKEKGYSIIESHLLDTAAIILSGVRRMRKKRKRRKKERKEREESKKRKKRKRNSGTKIFI